MKSFIYVFIGVGGTMLLFLIAFVLYEQNETVRFYKRSIVGYRQDYEKLQKEFNSFLEHSKNLKSITILAKEKDSDHITIANLMDLYARKFNGDVSMYYKNLTTQETIIIDGDKKYYMASLYKVPLTLFILDEINSGKKKLTDTIAGINIERALDKIITESNNEYALTLVENYGWKSIEQTMKPKLGIDFTFTKSLDINIKDMGHLFEEIALSLNISDWESTYLLELLNNQKRTSKLPKYLPQHIYSHNKTGEFEQFSHDAGIFYTPKANYILIVMSKTKTPGDANEQMAQLSSEIYESFNLTN